MLRWHVLTANLGRNNSGAVVDFVASTMKRRPGHFNPKRAMAAVRDDGQLKLLAARIGYGGNPEHKRRPGSFGLTPPSDPRPHKSLCDATGVFRREDAIAILRDGVLRGLVSSSERDGFPRNIWSVTPDGTPVEAQLENAELGTYHAYPMPEADPFRAVVQARWMSADPGVKP
jgi:hypothetical protein